MDDLEKDGWLPIVLCPTDGVWRLCRLPDGAEVQASFDGIGLLAKNRWQTKTFLVHNPARPSPVDDRVMMQPYDTFVVADLEEGTYPTHFRPNDTVFGPPRDSGHGR